ncbi:DUF817 family protein [Peribacillus alkalitolerans]|uniref:DUF817 family protein n=1 Tax=Peribacillus alkalitolerans TaxID=1550385 RepID=UPI0013D369F8|nr:DUF817 family protein [Peribacillus alkalitolerans]
MKNFYTCGHFKPLNWPPIWIILLVSVFIYNNFYTHHFIYDFRWVLKVLILLVFYRIS